MKFGNLHLHSLYSDGVLSPKELCEKAKKMGYKAISITDHNTVSAWPLFIEAAAETKMDYLLGMECYAYDDDFHFHIVAYDFDPSSPLISRYIKENEEAMYVLTKARFKKCLENGVFGDISWRDVEADAPPHCWMCNEHVFYSLVKRTETKQADYWNFIKAFHSQNTAVPEPPKRTSTEVIKMIREAGGIPSLAHPHKQTSALPRLYAAGLLCAEYDHPNMDKEDSEAVLQFAKDHNIYLSGGTDHTGLLANHVLERGVPFNNGYFLTPSDTDVRCGVSKSEFEAIKYRLKE